MKVSGHVSQHMLMEGQTASLTEITRHARYEDKNSNRLTDAVMCVVS